MHIWCSDLHTMHAIQGCTLLHASQHRAKHSVCQARKCSVFSCQLKKRLTHLARLRGVHGDGGVGQQVVQLARLQQVRVPHQAAVLQLHQSRAHSRDTLLNVLRTLRREEQHLPAVTHSNIKLLSRSETHAAV